MAQSQKMAKTSERTAKLRESQRVLKANFKEKFGHVYDTQGYHGHPLYGYHCRGCGIHISRIAANKGLREQLNTILNTSFTWGTCENGQAQQAC